MTAEGKLSLFRLFSAVLNLCEGARPGCKNPDGQIVTQPWRTEEVEKD